MTIIGTNLHPKIISIVDQIGNEYCQNQGLILTEDDLKCLIYSRLSQLDELKTFENTIDEGIKANFVHAELSWYDSNSKLAIKPDITILDPKNLSILKGVGNKIKLPSKQYSFTGSAIIFEIKFIRIQSGITKYQFKKTILKDFAKIKSLFNRIEDKYIDGTVYCFFIVFSKTSNTCQEFEDFINKNKKSDTHLFLIKNGNINFKNKG